LAEDFDAEVLVGTGWTLPTLRAQPHGHFSNKLEV
jgi:hypothetical protein